MQQLQKAAEAEAEDRAKEAREMQAGMGELQEQGAAEGAVRLSELEEDLSQLQEQVFFYQLLRSLQPSFSLLKSLLLSQKLVMSGIRLGH